MHPQEYIDILQGLIDRNADYDFLTYMETIALYQIIKEMEDKLIKQSGLKLFTVLYYNRFACQNQLFKVKAKNEFRAGREFYRQHDRKSYFACIESIYED